MISPALYTNLNEEGVSQILAQRAVYNLKLCKPKHSMEHLKVEFHYIDKN